MWLQELPECPQEGQTVVSDRQHSTMEEVECCVSKPEGSRRAPRHQGQEAKELWALAQVNLSASDKVPVPMPCEVKAHLHLWGDNKSFAGRRYCSLVELPLLKRFPSRRHRPPELWELSFPIAACYKPLLTLVGLQVLHFINAPFIYRVSTLHCTLFALSPFLQKYSL